MQNKHNPWADTANKAVGALYKHYMSKPSAFEQEQSRLKNELINSQIATQTAQQTKLGHESQGLVQRNGAPSQVGALLSQYLQNAPAQQSVTPAATRPQVLRSPPGALPAQPVNAPLSVRNNNPLNIRPIGASKGFEGYASPQEGFDAAKRDLMVKLTGKSNAMKSRFGQGYQPTLANLINTWAPPSENDTNNYLNVVAKRTGIDPSQVLTPADIDALLPAMTHMEGGPKATEYFYGGNQGGGSQPSPIAAAFSPQTRQAPQQISPEQRGAYNQSIPALLEAAMNASILKPGDAPKLMQMIGGAMQLPPEQLANIQSGAGTDYANTQAGFREEENNNLNELMNVSAGASVFDPSTNEVLFTGPTKQGGGQTITLPDGTVISENGGQAGFGKVANNSLDKNSIVQDSIIRSIDTAQQGLAQDEGQAIQSTGIGGAIVDSDAVGIASQLPVLGDMIKDFGLSSKDATRVKVNRTKLGQVVSELGRFYANGAGASDRFTNADREAAENDLALLKAATKPEEVKAILSNMRAIIENRIGATGQLRVEGPNAAGTGAGAAPVNLPDDITSPEQVDGLTEEQLNSILGLVGE